MKNIIYFLIGASISTSGWAHGHREHGAHVHGAAKMNIAFDGVKGKVELHGPGDSFIGFEHEAKSASDKKSQAKALETLEKKISEMVVFEPSLSCEWAKDVIEVDYEQAGHSDIDANWNVVCKKSIAGTKLILNIQKFFPKVKDLDLQILADSLQVSAEAKKSGTEIMLKPSEL